MKYHILFYEKNKKYISKCCLLKILLRVLSITQASILHPDTKSFFEDYFIYLVTSLYYLLQSMFKLLFEEGT